MKKYLLVVTTFVFFSALKVSAQDNFKRKVVYGELLGSGVIGSVNYDFRFAEGNDGLGMRVGVGFLPGTLLVPIEVNRLHGKGRLALEYGLGATAGVFFNREVFSEDLTFGRNDDAFGVIGYAKIGVRLTPLDNGLFLNLNYNPMFNREQSFPAWFGLGIGYSWKKKSR